jgi:KipI family sensor histidine kinase inhibitor
VRAAGDAALIVRLPEKIDPQVNAWCIALARTLKLRFGASTRDIVIGYSSVTVYFDPLRVDAAWLQAEIDVAIGELENEFGAGGEVVLTQAIVDVPVRYGGEEGPDLADVARFAGCSEPEVIERHSQREYRVYLVGFVPGFAYMAEVDASIAAPRRASPRTAVPAGSVAIAGGQTGIYPAVTPGGWNIIGRTSLLPYDPRRRQPFLFRPGDRVRFRSV